MEKIKLAFEDSKQEFESLIDKICGEEIERKLGHYERVTKAFSQFFNQEDIGALIDRKADLELVRRVQDAKASRQELKNVHKMAELLNVKLKHVSVLQAEMAEQIIPPKVSSNFKDAQDLKASNIKKEKLSK